ncbi:MAG: hypothetical protein J6Y15_11580 [Bacteroidaceae bacterium]|nr:hypothetical protein [Bacteroidaceae bacterium]
MSRVLTDASMDDAATVLRAFVPLSIASSPPYIARNNNAGASMMKYVALS